MPTGSITIATRESPLALWQANHVKQLLQASHPSLDVKLLGMKTEGDRFLSAPLGQAGGKGLFIKELEQCLLDGTADMAVHSMKDVTVDFPGPLQLNTILAREDPRDAFISNEFPSLTALPEGAVVGTSSMRRQCQLKHLRPDLEIRDLRGNVGTRLNKLDAGDFDAIILAAAGIKRLNLSDRIRDYLGIDEVIPAIGQGAIGIESRRDDEATNTLIAALDDPETHRLVEAERIISRRLYGGCQLPIAAHASMNASRVHMRAMVGRLDGSKLVRLDQDAAPEELEDLAGTLADGLLQQGADEILAEVLDDRDKDPALRGLRILVTRPAGQARALCTMIEQRGGIPIRYPLFEIRPVMADEKLRAITSDPVEYQAVIFVSRNAVRFGLPLFGDRLRDEHPGLFAVGQSTAEALRQAGFTRVFFPGAGAGSEPLLELPELNRVLDSGARILIVRGQSGREFLARELVNRGAAVDYAEVYERVSPCYDKEYETGFWEENSPDIIILTSRDAVDNLLQRIPAEYRHKALEARTVVMSERVAGYVTEQGFRQEPAIIDRPDDHGIVSKCVDIAGSLRP